MKRKPAAGLNKTFDETNKKKSVLEELMGMLRKKDEED